MLTVRKAQVGSYWRSAAAMVATPAPSEWPLILTSVRSGRLRWDREHLSRKSVRCREIDKQLTVAVLPL